jgi:neutral ceramidase
VSGLHVGHAVVRLEVTVGSSMAGYVARSGTVSGELQPLEVGAVTVAGDSGLAVLLVADLLQVDDDLATEARLAVAAAVGTVPDLVWLTATHTHSGPMPGDVREQTVTSAVSVARAAIEAARPASVTLHRGDLAGVGGQRTGESRRTSVPVEVLRVSEPSGEPRGLVGVVPVHPTVLGADSTGVSPDLPGAIRRSLPVWSLVATGAAGDVSTRPHRRAQTPEEVDRLGALAAQALLDTAETRPLATASDVVGGWVESVGLAPTLPGAAFRRGALEAARRALAQARAAGDPASIREAAVALEGAELAASTRSSGPVPCATAYLDLGGFRLLGLGGEPFLDLAPGGTDVLIGYANGYAGYLPTRAAFEAAKAHPERPDYEVLVSRVAPGQPERALAVIRG